MSPPVVPQAKVVTQLFQFATLQSVIAIMGYMSAVPNPVPGGPTIVVPVYPRYWDMKFTEVGVNVSFVPSAHDFGVGESENDTYGELGVPTLEVYAAGSRLNCHVYAIKPGLAGYLADVLYSGMVAAYAINPDTGEISENAMGKRIAESGLTVVGLADWSEVESDPEAKRLYGQFYQVHVSFNCNLDIMWQGGATIVGPIQVLQQIISAQTPNGAPIQEEFDIT